MTMICQRHLSSFKYIQSLTLCTFLISFKILIQMVAASEWPNHKAQSQIEVGPRGHQNFQFPEIHNIIANN